MATENPTVSEARRRGGIRPVRERFSRGVEITGLRQLGTTLEDFLKLTEIIGDKSLTGPVNNLARSIDALDFTINNHRFLAYPKTAADDEWQERLAQYNIPQFARIASPNPLVTITRIPTEAFRVDSIDFPEVEVTDGNYTGALEIMRSLGLLLSKIRQTTGLLPTHFSLSQVAFITGDKNITRLIPPYMLSGDVAPEEVVARIQRELMSIDPVNHHEKQIEVFSHALLSKP